MKKIVGGLLILVLCSTKSFAEPKNLTFVKMDLIHYHDSGQYEREHLQVFQKANRYLLNRIKSHKEKDKPLAVVFDIDDTCLSNYPDLLEIGFGKLNLLTSAKDAADPILPGCPLLYKTAQDNNVAVFFITGRHPDLTSATVENLKKYNITQWKNMVFKPNDYKEASVIPYKSQARANIVKQGYDIVLSIGDQLSDLRGGYADRTFKLPNPYYYLP